MAVPRWQRLMITALKSTVAVLVLWAVGRHVLRAWNDLNARNEPLRFELGWLVGSGLLYLAGLLAYGRFYERILRASPTPVGLGPALRAYVVSHLGKYVPGKAMVVVIRAGMVVPFGARASTAAIATFYETLVMMAAGGLVSAAGLRAAPGPTRSTFVLPGGPARACRSIGWPHWRGWAWGWLSWWWSCRRYSAGWSGLVSLPFPGVGPETSPRITAGLLGKGLLWSTAGWVLLGLSQLAVVRVVRSGRRGEADRLRAWCRW